MKRLMVSLGIVLVGIVFCVNLCYAQCPTNTGGPIVTVYKYFSGKKNIQEKWECALINEFYGNTVCFTVYTGYPTPRQRICISGDYKIEYPMNEP
jgi:hypothetical protein